MAIVAEKVGARIKGLREQAGITQKGLAEALGTSPVQVSKYERGVQFPREDTLLNIAEALGVGVDDILGQPTDLAQIAQGLPRDPQARELGAAIRKLRDGRPIKRLAPLAGLPDEHWAWYEEGVCAPSLEVLERIAETLDTTAKELLGYDPAGADDAPAGISAAESEAHRRTQELLEQAQAREAAYIKERGELLARIRELEEQLAKPKHRG